MLSWMLLIAVQLPDPSDPVQGFACINDARSSSRAAT
jgi:hypothetical protein